MIARAGLLLLMLAGILDVSARAADRAVITPHGALAITLPADLLRKKEVKDHLTSGLTTVFLVATTARDDADNTGTTKGGARVEVRFALWEEQYVVTVIGPTGEEHTTKLDSEAELERWWGGSPLIVSPPRRYGPRVDVRVRLTMLPFSSREQSDTRRWLARTLSASAGAGDRTPAQSAEVLRIIVETSIRRRPLLEREWSVRAVREGGP